MRFRRVIGEFEVVAACASDLEPQATGLLDKIAELHDRGPAIRDGTTIRFGWSLLTLAGAGHELEVCEPDFLADPLRERLPQVEFTLRVVSQQAALLTSLRVEGLDAGYRDRVVTAKGSLDASRIYLERSEPERPEDSGWYIGPVEEPERAAEDLEALYVYEIFQKRQPLMAALALPHGCLVVFQDSLIEAVFDSSGTRIDHRADGAA